MEIILTINRKSLETSNGYELKHGYSVTVLDTLVFTL